MKRALAVTSAAAFGAALVWAHGSHPGTDASTAGDGGAQAGVDRTGALEGFDFGQSSLAPSSAAAPHTSTRVS